MSEQAVLAHRYLRQTSRLLEENVSKQAIIDAQKKDIEKLRDQLKQSQDDAKLAASVRLAISKMNDVDLVAFIRNATGRITPPGDPEVNLEDHGRSHIQEEDDKEGDAQDTLGGAPGDTESLQAESEPETGSGSDGDDYPLPFVDDEGMPRCTACAWEVVDGLCQFCLERYSTQADDAMTEENAFRSVSTDDLVVQPSRRTCPRGDTPLLEIHGTQFFQTQIPKAYAARQEEYRALLQRGATRQMCKRFRLEISTSHGIVAWADDHIFEEFSGPAMAIGDKWKLYLGRAVTLESSDPDGKTFVEEFLEETVLYPPQDWSEFVYKTVLESPNIWATLPINPDEDKASDDTIEQDEDEIEQDEDDSSSIAYSIMDRTDNEIERATQGLPKEPAPVQDVYESTDEESDAASNDHPEPVSPKDAMEVDDEDEEYRATCFHPAEPDKDFDPDLVYFSSSSGGDLESEGYLSSAEEQE